MLKKRVLLIVLSFALIAGFMVTIPQPQIAKASFGNSDFLKASGTVLKNNFGQ
jgi:endoglucanase